MVDFLLSVTKLTFHTSCVQDDKTCMAVISPSSPIGRGSALTLKSMIAEGKTVFLVSSSWDEVSKAGLKNVKIMYSSLFGVVSGFWIVPPAIEERVKKALPANKKLRKSS